MVYLITFHGSVNYGAALQGYALYRSVRSLGHECTVIDYNREKHHRNYIYMNIGAASLKGKALILLTLGGRKRIAAAFDDFISRNECLSVPYNGTAPCLLTNGTATILILPEVIRFSMPI